MEATRTRQEDDIGTCGPWAKWILDSQKDWKNGGLIDGLMVAWWFNGTYWNMGISWEFHGTWRKTGPREENMSGESGAGTGLDDHKSWTRNLWRGQDNTAMIHII